MLFFLCCITVFAQPKENISGTIFDSISKKTIANAEVVNLNQSNKTFSDQNGNFTISSTSFPCVLEIHILGGITKKIKIDNANNSVQVDIFCKPIELSAVQISCNLPVQIMAGKKYYITDYEFLGDNLILLAFDYQNMMSPTLLLTDTNGDTLSRLLVWKPLKLCKDFDGKVFFVNKTTSFEISVENNQIKLTNPISNEKYAETNDVIIDHVEDNYFLKQFQFNNQILSFYSYDGINDKLNCFRTISDNDNILRNRWGSYFDGKEEDIRFQQLIMLKEVFAPFVRLADTIYLFNFLESKLEKYALNTDTLNQISITFQKEKNYERSLFVDENQSKVYNLFVRNGISFLKEIDLCSGKIAKTIQIPEFVFVENIKVHNGSVYFLYKEKYLDDEKKLFKMKI